MFVHNARPDQGFKQTKKNLDHILVSVVAKHALMFFMDILGVLCQCRHSHDDIMTFIMVEHCCQPQQ